MKRLLPTVSCALVTLLCGQLRAQEKSFGPEAPASASDLEKLREEIKQQSAAYGAEIEYQKHEVARLQNELEAVEQSISLQQLRAMEEAQANKAALMQGNIVRSRRLGVTLSGFLQVDWNAWKQSSVEEVNPSTGQPLNDQRFLLRRARVRTQIDYSIISGAIEFDGNTTNGYTARIIGAEVSLVWRNPDNPLVPYMQLTMGSFKTPYGFEILQSDKERLFMERSNMERALFPGEYDLGIRLSGGWRFLRYAIAGMNGDPIGEKLFPGRDPNQSKDIVGRVGIESTFLKRLGVAAGFSADYGDGFHKGIAASKDTLTWRDVNEDGVVQLSELGVINGQTGTPSSNFQRWAIGGDLLLQIGLPKVGAMTLYGEVTYATNLDRATLVADPVAQGRSLREMGWYAAITQELTPYGMIGVRYDRYDPDRDSNDLRGGVQVPRDLSYSTLSVAAAARYPGYGRLSVEYQHNTNSNGRTMAGLPTTLADDAFIIRGQVEF
jgi:hypothetical protein